MINQVARRITTGIDQTQSIIIADEKVKTFIPYSIFPSFQIQELFYTEENPPSINTRHFNKPYDIQLPPGALRFMKIRMPTKAEMTNDLIQAGESIPEDWTKYNLHSTKSIDYIYILSGAITGIVGEQQFELKEGDFLAQVGPLHTWINNHENPCFGLCVMVGIL